MQGADAMYTRIRTLVWGSSPSETPGCLIFHSGFVFPEGWGDSGLHEFRVYSMQFGDVDYLIIGKSAGVRLRRSSRLLSTSNQSLHLLADGWASWL